MATPIFATPIFDAVGAFETAVRHLPCYRARPHPILKPDRVSRAAPTRPSHPNFRLTRQAFMLNRVFRSYGPRTPKTGMNVRYEHPVWTRCERGTVMPPTAHTPIGQLLACCLAARCGAETMRCRRATPRGGKMADEPPAASVARHRTFSRPDAALSVEDRVG